MVSRFKGSQGRLSLLPVIALAVLTGILALQIHSLENSSAWIDHTDVVIARMRGLLRLIIDEETGMRGYLLTGQQEFLEPYLQGSSEIDSTFAELKQLVSDSPEQTERLRTMEQEQHDWVVLAAQRLNAQKPREQMIAEALDSKHRMDHIRTLEAQFIQHENALRVRRASHATFLSGSALLVLVIGGVVVAAGIVFYTLRLQQSEELLRIAAEQHAKDAEALRESESRYRTLFESIDEGFCIVEMIFDEHDKPVDFRFIATNLSFEKQTGLRRPLGKTMRELAPQHEQHWFDIYGRIAITGEPERFQERAEELHRWFDGYAFRVGPAESRRVAVFFKDITRTKLTEEALRTSERRFRAIYERAPVGIEQVALDGRLMMVNSTQCAMLGYSESELLSKTFEDITHPEDLPREAVLLKSSFDGERDSYSMEKRYIHKNGTVIWVSIVSTMVRDAFGTPEYRITIVEDITLRKQAEQALIRAEKLAVTGRMASAMAHEINNPLGAALNSLYLATLDDSLSESAKQYVDLAQRELARVAQITKQTLGFYRETGQHTKVDLREVADSVVNLYRSKLKNKEIKVEQRCSTKSSVYAIEGEVRQILSNLLSNSIDAVGQHGYVHLRVAGPMMLNGNRPAMRITVSDNGSGIDPQNLEKIFEPFFSTKEATGTGLGLWVTQELVRKHHGRLKARSRLGKGTVFQVLLPVERRNVDTQTQGQSTFDISATA